MKNVDSRRAAVLATLLLALAPVTGLAGGSSLVLVERRSDSDRNAVIEAGIALVAETNDAWLALGDPADIAAAAARFSLPTATVVEDARAEALALIGLRPGVSADDLVVCGHVVGHGDGWQLVASETPFTAECLESTRWFILVLDLEPLKPYRKPPVEWGGLADGSTTLVPDPLVQDIVDLIDTPLAMSHWTAIAAAPTWTTRYSTSQGCIDATAYVHGLFEGLGLWTEYQHHTAGHADNVIGTLPGSVTPENVYIAIGHIDDMPSSGPAPGADDNASGSAMVTAAAEVMAGYCFTSTVKFITVTGEEFGLYGSEYYADAAAAANEDIQAVLNGDMIGWEGNGQPAVENLDVIYNPGSFWLAQAMVDAAADYATGLPINALNCPSMAQSDHWPFWSNGYSAICGITDDEGICGSGGHYPYYHTSSDTIANCGAGGPDFEAAAIRTYVATLAHLAQPIARIPDQPTGLVAQPDGDNRIALSWTPQGPGIEYTVYRFAGGCSDPGPATAVGQTSAAAFVDTSASGGVPYAYNVVATAAGSCTSQLSACVEATTSGACTEPPTFAGVGQVTNAAASSCRLTVDWQPPQHVWCGGPVAYNLYRSTVPGFTPGPDNRIAELSSATSYDDSDIVFGESYVYVARAVDLAHGGEDGNTHEVTGSPTGPFTIGTWTDDAGDTGAAQLIPESPWTVAVSGGNLGPKVYLTGSYGNNVCASVTTPSMMLGAGSTLTFWSKYQIENSWDKGVVEISSDGGSTWAKVPVNYPGSSTNTSDACGLSTGTYFTGSGTPTWAQYTASLAAWDGLDVILRWRFSSDGSVTYQGWWVDDIAITNVMVPGSCDNQVPLFADDFESGDTSAWSR